MSNASGLSGELLLSAYRQMKLIREFEERLHIEIADRRDPGLHASVRRPGGGRCRRLQLPRRPGLHREHPSGTRSLHRQGLRCDRHDEGNLRAGTGSAAARAARCTSPISRRACWAPTRSSAAARRSPSAPPWPQAQRQRLGRVAFGGDGALNQGTVFEAMNLAVVLKVPAIFVFENNGYSEHTGAAYAARSGRSGRPDRGLRHARRARGRLRTSSRRPRCRWGEPSSSAEKGEGPSADRSDHYALLWAFRGRSAELPRKDEVAPARSHDGLPRALPRAHPGG